MSEYDDGLLHIVSAWQEMSWQSFRKAFDALHARVAPAGSADTEAVSRLRWRALRLLDWLGHCDVSAREGTERIYAAPPVLARVPGTFVRLELFSLQAPRLPASRNRLGGVPAGAARDPILMNSRAQVG